MNKPIDIHAAQSVPLWIDGKHAVATSSRAGDITNPATGRVTKRVPLCNAADIDAAVQAARRAFPAWPAAPPPRRARILLRFRGLLDQNKAPLPQLITPQRGKRRADPGGPVPPGLAARGS